MVKIKVLLGSSRPGRFGNQPAEWLMRLAQAHQDAAFELVDLKELNLPFLDEPVPPIMGKFEQPHSKKWSQLISESDGFLFITPEYNHSYSAVLKNAIDFLAREWFYKPVGLVSYGADAGGARATEHLRAVTGYLRMYDLGEFISIPNYWSQLDQDGKFQPTPAQDENAQKLLLSLVLWAKLMREGRQALSSAG